jgi:thiamine biosynthesis lipoprotein
MMTSAVSTTQTVPQATVETELATRSMGGELRLLVASAPQDAERADRDVRQVAGRIDAWARRLTRFSATSDLGLLNHDPERSPVAVRPTIAAVLSHARGMRAATGGTVDVTLLDARVAAETGEWSTSGERSAWQLTGEGRQRAVVRDKQVRFDLDGVAKGWIADRALRLLAAYPSALVDADGDVAVRSSSADWSIAVADPVDELVELARLRPPRRGPTQSFGVATSGTSVHRWHRKQGPTHHLIDPATRRPAATDVIQATVVAASTGLAEALAKSAVIRGWREGCALLDRAGAWAALLLLEDGELMATPGTRRWLA